MDPDHGWKGKQRWITSDDDLKDMYKAGSKMEILIWCFLPSKIEMVRRSVRVRVIKGTQLRNALDM